MVDIGCLDKSSAWKLESRFFPCKAGGKPAWLDLLNIPSTIDLNCSKCSQPCIFMCQIYAPISDKSFCFHRTIFIFMCLDPDCCQGNGEGNFKVFRSQLKRANEFYPYEPPREEPSWHPEINADVHNTLCVYCGCRAALKCAACKKVNYCSKQHQVLDWKAGHKHDCKTGKRNKAVCNLLPEFEILVERECLDPEPEERSDAEKLEDYQKLKVSGALGSLGDESTADEDLMKMAYSREDKHFQIFQSRIKQTPLQVMRYDRGGVPLWVSAKDIPESIPDCQYCGGPREFEFQILSHTLNYLNLDKLSKSIDWGTLAVYTCGNSCNDGPQYKAEYLWKQDFSD